MKALFAFCFPVLLSSGIQKASNKQNRQLRDVIILKCLSLCVSKLLEV